jgi:hypothetical protein
MVTVDDALALAGHVLTAYSASGPEDTCGPDLLWADQLARALRELADAVSTRHVTPVVDRPVAVIRKAGDRAAASDAERARRLGSVLARIVRGRAGRGSEAAVVLTAVEVGTVRQALADAGAWHCVYRDCAACVADDECADPRQHEVLAAMYAALRAWLGGEAP